MKFKTSLFIVLCFCLFSVKNHAQQCGTPSSGVNIEFTSNYNKANNDEPICINISFHIVRKTDSSGGFSPENIDSIIENLNEFYNPHNINFKKEGVDFINSSAYYSLLPSEFNELIKINNKPNSINFYLVNSAYYAGRAEAILSKNLVTVNSFALTPTSAHEIGHCLNLWHTHHGLGCNDTGGCAEAIDGSNCSTCGDFVCDTPADPCVLNKVDVNCEYIGGGGYNPDPTNIMSYGANCRDNFTNGQGERMINSILGSELLQQVVNTNCAGASLTNIQNLCYDNSKTIEVSNIEENTTTWQTSSNVSIVAQSNSGITIKASSATASGEGWVKATLSNGTVLQEEFWVGKMNVNNVQIKTNENANYTLLGGQWAPLFVTGYQGADQIQWKFTGTGIMKKSYGIQPERTILIKPKNNYNTYGISVGVRLKNNCGWSEWKYQLFQVEFTGNQNIKLIKQE